jgi:hypothetical protein
VSPGEGRGTAPVEGRGVSPMGGRGVSPGGGGRGVSPVLSMGRGCGRGRQVCAISRRYLNVKIGCPDNGVYRY